MEIYNNIKTTIEDLYCCDPISNHINHIRDSTINNYLNNIKYNRDIQDYNINTLTDHDGNFYININIRPIRSIETINININSYGEEILYTFNTINYTYVFIESNNEYYCKVFMDNEYLYKLNRYEIINLRNKFDIVINEQIEKIIFKML